jgi:inorganic pyrophosphatase/exopolyphosphatase
MPSCQTAPTDVIANAPNDLLTFATHPTQLIFLDDDVDLKQLQQLLGTKLGIILVDHNTLAEQQKFLNPNVIAIYDHHADSGEHPDANPRIIEKNGSGVSLPTHAAMNNKQQAQLLRANSPLCQLIQAVIMIDTDNFSTETKKALPIDYEVFQYCNAVEYRGLQQLKKDVSRLSTLQLLQRDTKFAYADVDNHKHLSFAIASIPSPLERITHKDPQWHRAVEQFIRDKQIDFMVILTSYSKPDTGKHARQLLVYIPKEQQQNRRGRNNNQQLQGKALLQYINQHLEADQVLSLKRMDHTGGSGVQTQVLSEASGAGSGDLPLITLYDQTNVKASRKQVMPLVDSLVAKL